MALNVGGSSPLTHPSAKAADTFETPGIPGVSSFFGAVAASCGNAVEPVKDVGGGIKVASVRDLFGNLFSIIENQRFKLGDVR